MNQSVPITHLKDGRFIEIYQLEIMDDSVFKVYQRYDFYQILWFTKVEGNNSYFIDFVDYSYQSNQAVVIYPGQIDRIHLEQKEGYLFAVDKETFLDINEQINSKYLSGYFSNVFVPLGDKAGKRLGQLMEFMFSEYRDENRFLLLKTYMQAFLFEIASCFDESTISSKQVVNHVAVKLQKLIENYYTSEQNTSFYAEELGVSAKKLNEIALQSSGSTVKQLLQKALLLAVKREIRLGQKNIKEIAFDLGFEDPAYLTRFFKKHTGLTPTQFRDED